MVFSCIATHDQNAMAVAKSIQSVGHCARRNRLCQSRDCGAVSDTGLVFDVNETQSPHHRLQGPAFLVVESGTADMSDTIGPVYHLALSVSSA